ncbi:MAG: hypothetical protein WC139_07985 [Candidatus Kapaibacterium sp.]
MALLRRPKLGRVYGKTGDTVTQRRFGKDVVSIRPEHYFTVSENLINTRKEFKLKVQFARSIRKSVLLTQCWENCNIKSISGYHKALSYNSTRIKNDITTPNNIITPPYDISNKYEMVYIDSFTHKFEKDSILFEYSFSDNKELMSLPYSCIAVFFVFFSDGKANRFEWFTVPVVVNNENSDGIKTVKFEFTDEQKEMIKLFRLMRGYFAAVKETPENKKNMVYSNSEYFEINLVEYFKQEH